MDSGCLPHLLVNAEISGVKIPSLFVEDGRIVLNVSPSAVRDFVIGAQSVEFNARFNGASMLVSLPMASILAIYARENGQGFFFDEADDEALQEEPVQEKPMTTGAPKGNKPGLKLVK